jgi:ubiquinone/menaquinone biosynthesis C-methylase UbiE
MAKGGKFRVTGLDISKTFVELARKNAVGAGIKVDFREGNASAIPFADNSFDLLVCRAAFKNFSEPVKALKEMNRVLRPGGTGVVIDLRRDTPMSDISKYADGLDISALNQWLIKQSFRFMLLKRAYTGKQFDEMVKRVPFGKVEVRDAPLGVEIWFSK